MLHEGSLYIIDFQDARMGPDTYDLVSLLRDSYVDFTEQQVDELIAFFLALRGASEAGADPQEFRRRFDVMALQRNLKALGTFGFQTTSRGNTVYIQYIPRTLNYVRANLAQYPRFGRLRETARRAPRGAEITSPDCHKPRSTEARLVSARASVGFGSRFGVRDLNIGVARAWIVVSASPRTSFMNRD